MIHTRIRHGLLTLATATLLAAAPPVSAQADDARAARFAEYGRPGVWLVQPVDQPVQAVVAGTDLETAYWPASSIKPLLALVALETGALSGPDEVIDWDGRPYPNFPDWERPMMLHEAMRTSSESYFRTLATRIGHDALADWVARVDYGNGTIGPEVERAWHDGVLRITPHQQLAFIEQLRRGTLPFAPEHQAAVRASMADQPVGDTRVFGKTGTHPGRDGRTGVGWFVGWTEGGPEDASFVLMVTLEGMDGRDRRVRLAQALLRDGGQVGRAD